MFTLPPLPYKPSGLDPVISELTLEIHHGKHHARYVQVVNELLATSERRPKTLEDVVIEAARSGDRKLFNNAAQAWNHGFFWACMSPVTAGVAEPSGELAKAIEEAFGGLQALRDQFLAEGANHFGSGWVWIVAKAGGLTMLSTHDGETPLTSEGAVPLLVCDVWEHAYYLDYKNARHAFLQAWWDLLVDWNFVAKQLAAARADSIGWRYPLPEGAP